jgi:hypothetical protein
VINVVALVYQLAAATDMAWPRGDKWYDRYLVLLSLAVILGVGLLYLFGARPHLRSDSAAGDAIPTSAPLTSPAIEGEIA